MLGIKHIGFMYIDTFDHMETPDANMNGYIDAMGLGMLAGSRGTL